MLVAMPIANGRISPVFDVAGRLWLVKVREEVVIAEREVVLAPRPGGQLPEVLGELQVDLLICGAISQFLQTRLEAAGMRVVSDKCGSATEILQAWLNGRLDESEYQAPGCQARAQADRNPVAHAVAAARRTH